MTSVPLSQATMPDNRMGQVKTIRLHQAAQDRAGLLCDLPLPDRACTPPSGSDCMMFAC